MRQELNGVKTAVGALGVQLKVMQTEFGAMKTEFGAMKSEFGAMKTEFGAMKSEFGAMKTDVSELKTITRNTSIIVTGHTETLGLIMQRLRKLDELDGIKKCLEIFTAEIIASRHERALTGKSFSDQQAMLTDHELRLTRIELRGKQS